MIIVVFPPDWSEVSIITDLTVEPDVKQKHVTHLHIIAYKVTAQ